MYGIENGHIPAPLLSWVSIVIAGAIRSVGHIVDYRKKKKARKAAQKEHVKEVLAERAAAKKVITPNVDAASNQANVVSSNKRVSATPSVTPFLAIGAVIVGALLLKKR